MFRFLTLIFCLLLNSQLSAQLATPRLDSIFEASLKLWNVPGIVQDGEIKFADGYGVLQEGGKEQVDTQTMFAIAKCMV